jgi:THUMP domain-like
MSAIPLHDLQWLGSDEGHQWLARARELLDAGKPLHQVIAELRRILDSAMRVAALIEQCRLRKHAKRRFACADRMLFDDRLLQQATDEQLAAFKARRFVGAPVVADICCGLGGDSIALAGVSDLLAVDQSEVACFLAGFNTRHAQVLQHTYQVIQDSAENIALPDNCWFHIDPDRRAKKTRSIRFGQFSPGPDVLMRIVNRLGSGAIKTAPASDLPAEWVMHCERQWLGNRHECLQQVLWFGECARFPGGRSVAATDSDGSPLFEWSVPPGSNRRLPKSVDESELKGRVLHECHATVYAAELTAELAEETGLDWLGGPHGYLVGSEAARHGALTAFEILETLPMDESRVRRMLEQLDCGTLEVKHRGIDHRFADAFHSRHFRFHGQRPLVLVLARHSGRHIALVCERRSDH